MLLNPIIPPDNENRWSAFLNGEPGISEVSNPETIENSEFTAAWEAAGNNFSYSVSNPDQAWFNLQKELSKSDQNYKVRSYISRIFRYAALFILVMGIGFATYKVTKSPERPLDIPAKIAVAETSAHPLNLTVITFPDGSTAKMNANTKIEYPLDFAVNVRKVKLSGEAFFEVTRDTTRPFIIETLNASVEVLGTSFNISAYPKAGLVEVNVKTGKVKLMQNADGLPVSKSIFLPAGKRGWLKIAENEMGQSVLNPNYSSWISRQIIFQRTPLSEALSVLENTYHVKMGVENVDVGKIPYTANFANQSLDSIVKKIARTHKLKVKRTGDEIIFAGMTN